jgi:hypothetical protein
VFINPTYLGDYDSLASDFLLMNPGFLGVYGWVNTAGVVPTKMWPSLASLNRE